MIYSANFFLEKSRKNQQASLGSYIFDFVSALRCIDIGKTIELSVDVWEEIVNFYKLGGRGIWYHL